MLHAGLRLGDRYRLEDRIGAGGMGEVWRAVDKVLGRVVAVKAMLPAVAGQADFARRFLVEAKAMASVNHPAVASIHDFGHSGGVTFLVMEFIDGESLAQVVTRQGPLDPATVMRLVAQAADGLQAVHDRGIVHRDIKPANLMVRRDGRLLITDFGISRAQDATALTASGAILGTPTYLSPEQVLGRPATALSDIYSLGLAAYEGLAGRRPFEGDNPYAVALQRLSAAPRTLGGDVPASVLAVVQRALATEPADRWPSAAALGAAARATGAGTAGRVEVVPKSKRGRWGVLAALLVVIVVAGGAATAWWARSPEPSAGPAKSAAAGFVACDPMLCPVEPLCWGGLLIANGRALPPPRRLDCAEPHYWETFAATARPAGLAADQEDDLIDREDLAAACSRALLAARSRDRAATAGWTLVAWPIQLGDSRLIHCIAGPKVGGKSTGSVFSPA